MKGRIYPIFLILFFLVHCDGIRKFLIQKLGAADKYKAEGNIANLSPIFSGQDEKRRKIDITLREVASGFIQPTDMQFPPGESEEFFILEKQGRILWSKVNGKENKEILSIKVKAESEEGLLGLAFHPEFRKNGKIYVNYVAGVGKKDISRISEFTSTNPKDLQNSKLESERIIMEVEQPYENHNAGQILFGKDNMLYIGWGDGGWKDDPRKQGQNPKTFLGSMLRIDVDSTPDKDKAYKVPEDNPFFTDKCCKPETFAYGFRNPWRFSFDPKGRMILADVGQDLWEEVDIVEKGKNYGWNIREGSHCFEPKENCKTENLADPIYDYGRDDGQSITGGYVYTGKNIPSLSGKYVFADFVSGRVWALDLPENPTERVKEAYTLGKWPVLISSFAKDGNGDVYLLDLGKGKVFKIEPK
ncbi:MAG TPA: PQQ-dependent sugar dehydrogenase [Leptospiraceae bacterium]|nr:PQQ-dependent sugar dehydrogenase [Leptospiraceae bacterium]HMX33398.1 PQQ-dependent sugar dehydrogenase [Leptospiraceae bacterium]HMY32964.1 PQQ-dependent sugar dehydrogenase [Leptospiraceae bacterium]HMZ64578.1 PQQ-dependent sugar dehydrogenase [Leptospiraceae bacterium]HNA08185.1 PQQ-dependent sugar dehydrogenase [Leptospiraceae bacterium]